MKLQYKREHTSCMNYKTDAYKGFVLENLTRGNIFDSTAMAVKSNYIIFILEGVVEIEMDMKATIRVKSGEFFFIPFCSAYKLSTKESGLCIYLNFLHNNIDLCDANMLTSYMSAVNSYNTQFRAFKANDMLSAFLQNLKQYMQLGINCQHFHALKEKELMIIFRTTYSKEDILGLFYPILGKNINFRESVLIHSDTVFNRKDLADRLGMSVSDLARKFKEEFGLSVHSWILKHRNKRILEAASYPSITIKQLAYDFDFSSLANFNRYCKQHFQCTPTELISKYRNNKMKLKE